MRFLRITLLLAGTILAIGALRLVSVVAHAPMVGYANQFDTARTSACLGIWPDLQAPQRYAAQREAPIARYVEDPRSPGECSASSEIVFAGAGVLAWKVAAAQGLADPASMNLRFVGGFKAAALLLVGLLFTFALRRRPAWMLTHAAVFAAVLCDPLSTLWLNTLYTEFAALFFAYVAITCLVMFTAAGRERVPRLSAAVFGVALIGLGMSRQQHMFLPACLALLAWPLLRLHRAWWPVSMLAIACLPIVAQSLFVARPPSVSAANNVDVVLGALLPAARDQSQALMALGLPSQCGDVIGSTWYVTMGEDLRERCPDVFTLPKGRQLALLADDPLIAVRVLMKAAPLAQSALLHYVGAVEGRRLAGYGRADGLAEFSVAAVIERLPVVVYLGMVLGTLCLLLLAGSGWLVIALRGGIPDISMLLGAALSGTFAYAALTSVLGDGYVEVSRHFHLGSMALAGLLVLAAILGVLRVQGLMTRSNRPGTRPGWFEAIVIASWVAVGAACPLWLDAWKRQALTIGTIDEPQSNRVPAGVVLMHGWALDPLSDISVMTVVGRKTDIPAHRWLHPGDPQGAELAQIFPTYRDPHNARFEIAVDPARFPPGPLSLRTYARSVEGVLTEIDRRVLRWPER